MGGCFFESRGKNGNLSEDGRAMLWWFIKKWEEELRTESTWLRLGRFSGHL